jgi:DNA translocase FtsK/SpoIIIE-like protein
VIQNAVPKATGGLPAWFVDLPQDFRLALAILALMLVLAFVTKVGRRGLVWLTVRLARRAGRMTRKAARRFVRWLKVSQWAARMRMPVRLSHRLQQDRWRQMVEDRQLAGLKRGKVKRTPLGVSVRVTMNGKLDTTLVVAKVNALEAGLGLKHGSVRVEPDAYAHQATLHLVLRDPLRKPVAWPVPALPVSSLDLARLSMTPWGEWVGVNLRQRILIVGASGSGKSTVQRVLAASIVMAEDADLEMWDLKLGLESQHYDGKAVRRIINAEDCAARIEELMQVELPRRAKILTDRGTSTWVPSGTDRDLVIMVDEGAALIRELSEAQLDRLFTFVEQARAFGIYLWWATQFPVAENLPTKLRSQLNCVIALKMERASESRVVFEDLTKAGWTPHRLKARGWLLIRDEDHQAPDESRAVLITEAQFKAIVPVHQAPVPAPVLLAFVPSAGLVIPAMPTRPPLIPAQVTVQDSLDAYPPMPSEPPKVPAPRSQDASPADKLLRLLAQAGPHGMTAKELEIGTGISRSLTFALLGVLAEDGHVVKPRYGRYAAAAIAGEEATQ